MKRAIIALLLLAAIGGGAGAYYFRKNTAEITVNTSPVTRGDLVDTVGSTGTLEAVTTVQVGSQVSGNIASLGADFNSIVKKGQVIARLDPSLFEAQLQQARANLNQAKANANKSQSDLERSKVQLQDAQQKYTRSKELAAKSLLPQSDLDSAKIAVDTAQAGVQSAEATVAQSQAAVSQSEASVNQNQVNLDHTIITAPIDGIVIQRSVDVGQTVAASMQAPTIFIIAADLTQMQVNANIDESDVGRIRPDQTVTFRVDAYAGDTFEGSVSQIRLQPQVVQNVTTYQTIIRVPNPELKLKPGMTANLRVQIARRPNAVRVSNAAIRFRPNTDIFAALGQTPPPEAQFGGRGRSGRTRSGQGDAAPGSAPTVAPIANPGGQPAQPSGKPLAGAGAGAGARGDAKAAASQVATANPAGDAAGRRRGGTDGNAGGRGGGEGGSGGDRTARLLERFKTMTPDEQKQLLARLKDRGIDVKPFEAVMAKAPAGKGRAGGPATAPKYGAASTGGTIDALFAPLPVIETSGRVWLYVDAEKDKKELKPVNLRLGITDGTNTEVVSGDVMPGMEVVTGVIVGNTRQLTPGAAGNPLLPQGRGPGFPGGGGGGRGR